jgi:ferrous iron transport protein B
VASNVNTEFNMAASPARTEVTAEPTRLVLVGQPNVGKSALFGALTGRRVIVSNYPGTTVEIARGSLKRQPEVEVLDSPGVRSLSPMSEDERVTVEILDRFGSDPDTVVLQVAYAKDLHRGLLLTLQLGQRGIPALLALNMADEAMARGVHLDAVGLAGLLGIPVVPTIATQGVGLAEVLDALPQARVPRIPPRLPQAPEPGFDPAALARHHTALLAAASEMAARYSARADATATRGARLSRTLGRLSAHPVWGWPIFAACLLALYEIVGVFGAGTLVGLMEDGLFGRWINPLVRALFGYVPSSFVRDLFVGDYGLVTMGLTYGLAIVLPIVSTFFIVFALLEDSGYLPRLAAMADRAFRLMGLNGKAVLPMVLGLGCDTMATLTTRILETRKERLLATLLLALSVPCSAQLGVILALLGRLPLSAALVWLGAIGGVTLAVGWLGARLLPGGTSPFVVELPPMRLPSVSNVLVKTAARVEWYLREALPLFLAGTLLLFGLDRLHVLGSIIRAGEPLVTGLLGLPREAAEGFLIGFLRRDFAATRLFDLARAGRLDTIQLVVAMVTITLFIPCIANVFMIAKERGVRVAAAMAAFIFPLAFAAGGVVNVLMHAAGIWAPR